MTTITVALAQMAPAWMDGAATLDKVAGQVAEAADQGAQLVAFGEALAPGYPFWPERTNGAVFDSPLQKAWYALYAEQAVDIAGGQLEPLCRLARQRGIAICLGTIERATDRSAHSLYASLVSVLPDGTLGSVHRKLCPTYEERLVWSPGDGHGLRVHDLHGFRLGALNCWENWMPLPRAALYAQGENLHVASWPGSQRNTQDITRFMAREGRSFVLSVSGLMHADWLPDHVPDGQGLKAASSGWLADGGSCIAGPDGEWVIEPVVERETLLVAELDLAAVYRERQNFDPAGHYARPDVTTLSVNRKRQTTASFLD